MWHYTIQTNQDNFSCKKTKQEFDTKLDATKYFIETHLDKDEKFEACQVCVGKSNFQFHLSTPDGNL